MFEIIPYVGSLALLIALLAAGSFTSRRWPRAPWRRQAPPKDTVAWQIGRWNWHVGMAGGALAISTLPAWSAAPELRSLAVVPAICAVIDYAFIRRRA